MVNFDAVLATVLPWLIIFIIILIIWSKVQQQSMMETIQELREIILALTTREDE